MKWAIDSTYVEDMIVLMLAVALTLSPSNGKIVGCNQLLAVSMFQF